ncbi:MAG TPA: hypothetical protein VMR41_05590 [Patescibacteria group bacterium]|nr:hypothetical protein [Patescibacteria group bacterium]
MSVEKEDINENFAEKLTPRTSIVVKPGESFVPFADADIPKGGNFSVPIVFQLNSNESLSGSVDIRSKGHAEMSVRFPNSNFERRKRMADYLVELDHESGIYVLNFLQVGNLEQSVGDIVSSRASHLPQSDEGLKTMEITLVNREMHAEQMRARVAAQAKFKNDMRQIRRLAFGEAGSKIFDRVRSEIISVVTKPMMPGKVYVLLGIVEYSHAKEIREMAISIFADSSLFTINERGLIVPIGGNSGNGKSRYRV